MSKFYEPIENENDIKNDFDLRIAIHNKTRRAYDLLATLINDNQELYKIATLQNGEQAFSAFPHKVLLMDFHITMDAFIGMITNNLCVLLGKGRNDKLSIHKAKAQYDIAMIDEFYTKNEQRLTSLFTSRDKVYAHIDADVTASAFQHDVNFLGECVGFLMNLLLKKGANNE